jgi:hypothetical protein
MASVPVKDLRPLADWRDELGLDRLRADLIDGDLDACWYDHATGEFHQIPRAYWRRNKAVEHAIGWGWLIGGGLFSFSSSVRSCEIYAARPAKHAGGKDGAWGLAEDILENDDARARLPKRRGRLSELAKLIQAKLPDYEVDSIRRMIGPSLREWEERNPDK